MLLSQYSIQDNSIAVSQVSQCWQLVNSQNTEGMYGWTWFDFQDARNFLNSRLSLNQVKKQKSFQKESAEEEEALEK